MLAFGEPLVLLVERRISVLSLALWLVFAMGTVLLASFILKSSMFCFSNNNLPASSEYVLFLSMGLSWEDVFHHLMK